MARFQFRFEPILRLRVHAEEEVRQQLAAKDQQIDAERQKLAAVRADYERGLADKAADLAAGRLDRVHLYQSWFRRLQHAIVWHEDEIGRLQQQREKIVAVLAERMRERKIMEKLRERKAKQFDHHQAKLDQKRLDEFAARAESATDPGIAADGGRTGPPLPDAGLERPADEPICLRHRPLPDGVAGRPTGDEPDRDGNGDHPDRSRSRGAS